MSGKTDRRIRKGLNAIRRDKDTLADEIVRELLMAPLRQRLWFALRLVFRRGMR